MTALLTIGGVTRGPTLADAIRTTSAKHSGRNGLPFWRVLFQTDFRSSGPQTGGLFPRRGLWSGGIFCVGSGAGRGGGKGKGDRLLLLPKQKTTMTESAEGFAFEHCCSGSMSASSAYEFLPADQRFLHRPLFHLSGFPSPYDSNLAYPGGLSSERLRLLISCLQAA